MTKLFLNMSCLRCYYEAFYMDLICRWFWFSS